MRNIHCPYYDGCLNKAAKSNLQDLSCRSCRHFRSKVHIHEYDYTGYYLLLVAIFMPDIWGEYLEEMTLERLKREQLS